MRKGIDDGEGASGPGMLDAMRGKWEASHERD